ncbi:MAG: type restriction enzyme subunit, partial [Candidatus Atribacteria bacterium]|nr:type restriction enzyme subunit [Candidatus Atribacteria bacterium]
KIDDKNIAVITTYINDYIFDGEYLLIAEDGGNFNLFEETAYIMRGKFWVNNHVHILKGKNGILDNSFLMYFVNFQDISRYISGSTREKLNQRLLKSVVVPLPPLPEQRRIASILSQVDEVIEKEQKYKEKLERIKRGLMENLLTGRIRVNSLIEHDSIENGK